MEKSETDCDNSFPENKEIFEASDDVDASNDNQNIKCTNSPKTSQPTDIETNEPENGSNPTTEVDARPKQPSEVDAQPIIKPATGQAGDPIDVDTDKDCPYYVMEGVKKVVIFNHRKFAQRLVLGERKGTEVDVKSIQKTFTALGWDVDTYNDLTVAQIRKTIVEIQISEEKWSSLAIFLLSHGEDNGTIFASDYPFRVDQDILLPLAADKCPGLAGRPKLIFVQACQGQATDSGTSVDNRRRRHTSTDCHATYKIPNFADFLIFQASFWDHYSFRSPETGSWFIQSLCTTIDKSDKNRSLFEVLLEVSRNVAVNKESNVPGRNHLDKKKQIPLLYSTLLRHIYLKDPDLSKVYSNGLETSLNNDHELSKNVKDMKITSNDHDRGSQRSLFKDKMKDKECICM